MASLKPKKTKTEVVEEVEVAEEAAVEAPDLRLAELVDKLAARTGLRKGDLRTTLSALGAEVSLALLNGRTVKLKELGNLKPVRTKDTPNGVQVVCKLKPGTTEAEAPAQAAE